MLSSPTNLYYHPPQAHTGLDDKHKYYDVIIMSTHGVSYKTDHDTDLSDRHFHLDHPFHWFLSSLVPVSQFLVHHSPLHVYYLLHLLQVLVPQFFRQFPFLPPCFHLLHPQSHHCPKSRDKRNKAAILRWPRNCCPTYKCRRCGVHNEHFLAHCTAMSTCVTLNKALQSTAFTPCDLLSSKH